MLVLLDITTVEDIAITSNKFDYLSIWLTKSTMDTSDTFNQSKIQI